MHATLTLHEEDEPRASVIEDSNRVEFLVIGTPASFGGLTVELTSALRADLSFIVHQWDDEAEGQAHDAASIEIKSWDGRVLYTAKNATDVRAALEEAVRTRAYLGGADLAGADLGGADLGGAYLGGAYLGGAYLTGANLGGANLARANLARADLARADLARANLARANLARADLARADLAGAYLAGAYLAGAYGDDRTVLPEGWKINAAGLVVQS